MISNCEWHLWLFKDNLYVQYTKHEQWIQYDIGLDIVARQSSIRKIFSNFFDYTKIIIDILIIFFTQYFQKNDLLLTISPFNQRVQGSMFFSNFFCSSMNEMNEEEKNF